MRLLCTEIARRVQYVYIPAGRGASTEQRDRRYRSDIQAEISRLAFSKVRRTRQRLASVERLLADAQAELIAVKDDLATELRRYMPDLRSIDFQIVAPDVRELLQLDDILLDDGASTPLSQKGDGVKSLFTIAVLQYIARQQPGDHLILGIEEPEAHLHPNAVYKLKPELRALAEQHQVIITTHSPILIQRDEVSDNLIVDRLVGEDFTATARSARTLAEIRTSLGIKAQDNMTTAEVVLVVEGETESVVLARLFAQHNRALESALELGRVSILSANGASKVPSVIRALARDATSCLVLLDNDDEGRRAREELVKSALIGSADIFSVPNRPGCAETEFEDMFNPDLYLASLNSAAGTNMSIEEFAAAGQRSGGRSSRCAKWSIVVSQELDRRGKEWPEVRSSVRAAFANAIVERAADLDLREYPCLGDVSDRVVALLREEDDHARRRAAI
jgi:hypothetical protein